MRILFNICWFSLVFLVALSCNETAEVGTVAEEEFFVPNVFLQEGDSLLMFDTTGVLLYKESPFSGYLLAENNIERVKTMTPFINGLKEGLVIGHYPDSSICFKRGYRKGEKHGIHQGWYSTGGLKFQYLFREGLSEGNHREWYVSGKQCKDLNYKKGKLLGSQKEWFKSGKLKANYVVRENGRKYGLTGVRRCNNININKEALAPVKKE